jgi:hypothetical protein
MINTVMQRRARWLLARKDDLILPPLPPDKPEGESKDTTPPKTPLLPKP